MNRLTRWFQGWQLGLRLSGSLSVWSAQELYGLLKLIAILLAWKLLSLDYSALVDLVGRPPLQPATTQWLRDAITWVHAHVAQSDKVIRDIQLLAAASLVGGVFYRQRWLATVGLVCTLALYISAHQYAGWMFDIEFCSVLLLLAIAWPQRWSTLLDGTRTPSHHATAVVIAIQLYLGVAYFFTGWSKVRFSVDWVRQIGLEYLYPVMDVWHGSNFNWLSVPQKFHEWLMVYPAIGTVLALTTLLAELLWITCIVSRRARFVWPVVMFASHLAIFLASGILFLQLALIQLAVVAPWQRNWLPWRRANDQAEPAAASPPMKLRHRLAAVSLATLALVLVTVPAVTHWNLAFLPDWNQFGWSYASVTQPQTYYRLGYFNHHTGRVEPIPLRHFGFMDFQGVTAAGLYLNMMHDYESPMVREMSAESLETLLRTVRNGGSNQTMLGDFFCPPHLVSDSPLISRRALLRPFVMRAERHYDPVSDQIVGDWENIGDLATVVALQTGRIDLPLVSRRYDLLRNKSVSSR